ncbi:MAG: DUF4198 domain-containing protein [Sphingomicrobium sp.]
MKNVLGKFGAAASAAALLVSASVVNAHGIWFAQRANQLGLIYGVGSDDLDMVKRLPLIKGVSGYDAQWNPVVATLRAAGPIVLVDSDEPVSAVAAWMDNGVWSKTPDGEWHKKGYDEVPNAIISERTMKFAVHLLKLPMPKGGVPILKDQVLQIIPVPAAIPEQLGKPLTVKILFNGKPAAGALVKQDFVNDPDQEPLKAAADGTVTLNVRNQGLNVIGATFVGPSDQPAKYKKIEYLATLSFVLPHAPE